MRIRNLLFAMMIMVCCSVANSKLVCDEVEIDSVFSATGKETVHRNCRYTKGDIEPYYGSTLEEGEVSRITKHPDGTVTVYRAGRPGEREEWKEKSPGEWSRVR